MSDAAGATSGADAPHVLAARLRLSMVRLSRQLRRVDPSELTIAQFSALATVVRNGPLGVGQLAEIEGLPSRPRRDSPTNWSSQVSSPDG